MDKKPVIALCTPIAHKIEPAWFTSFRLLDRSMVGGWHHLWIEGQPVDVARNTLTQDALRCSDVTHLLWIDDDMVFPPDALSRLLSHDKDIVGGLCFDRRHPYKPVIAREFPAEYGYDPGTLGWLFDYPPDELIEVDATGGAFLLIKREVFEQIASENIHPASLMDGLTNAELASWAQWWTPLPELGASEDLSFMRRAQACGYKIHVDTGLKIGHCGEVIVDEAFAKRNRQFEYAQWHPEPMVEDDQGANVATVVIPTFNQKTEFLRAAVLSALSQSVPVEVIVVDDGSDKPVWYQDLHNSDRLRILRHDSNLGIADALNTGIVAAHTDWIAWLSSDDLFEPRKIEHQLSALLATGRICGYTGYNLKLDNRNSIVHIPTALWADLEAQQRILGQGCVINGSTTLIHKSVFDKVGLYDPSFKYAQDWEMWCRIGQEFLWFGMPDKLTTRREFRNLTARLNADKGPEADRKRTEDAIIREKYGRG